MAGFVPSNPDKRRRTVYVAELIVDEDLKAKKKTIALV